jgi:uncharacterized membrane protein
VYFLVLSNEMFVLSGCLHLAVTVAAMWSAEKELENSFQSRTQPNILILFLTFCTKAKLKYLALNVFATHERLEPLSALHIGVVRHWLCYHI